MSDAPKHKLTPEGLLRAQQIYLDLLPGLEAHARARWRHVRCPQSQDDNVQEALALCWQWTVRLVGAGKDPSEWGAAMSLRAWQQVRCGRSILRRNLRKRDVMSWLTQRREGYKREPLAMWNIGLTCSAAGFCGVHTRAPVPDQVAFRIDFPVWRDALPARDRVMVDELVAGADGQQVARRHGISKGRVHQIRRALRDSWLAFQGE